MPQRKDLVGNDYGRLTVVRFVGRCKFRNSLWECVCECGSVAIVTYQRLECGTTKSCGCLRKDANANKNRQIAAPIVGRRFGRLRVVADDIRVDNRRRFYCQCICDCGVICYCCRDKLFKKLKTHCGCNSRKQISHQRFGRLVAVSRTGCWVISVLNSQVAPQASTGDPLAQPLALASFSAYCAYGKSYMSQSELRVPPRDSPISC